MNANSPSHGVTIRGQAAGANPGQPYGRFGPMFGDLPACPQLTEAGLEALARVMVKHDDGAPIITSEPVDENNKIPAGYTYFGQFVDHDITFDPTPLGAQVADPSALIDFRTPALDLDSVYGRGPADQPYLYERDGLRLRVGTAMNTLEPPIHAAIGTLHDVQRLADGTATLGDKRNDENKIVSQIHGAIIALHNKIVMDDALLDSYQADRSTKEARFQAACTIVRWHYQHVVLFDLVERLCEPGAINDVLNPGGTPRLQFYLNEHAKSAYMPIEFAGAAYRLGHSMVRPSYSLNAVVLTRKGDDTVAPPIPAGDPSKERIPTFNRSKQGTENLNGFPGTLPAFWGIDWSFFLDDVPQREGGVNVTFRDDTGAMVTKPAVLPQPSYRIDAQIVEPLADLPEFFDETAAHPLSLAGNLAFRNLKRGQILRLPSGQAVAHEILGTCLSDDILWGTGSRIPLDPGADADFKEAFETTDAKRKAFRAEFVDAPGAPLKGNAPLWYYILREAEFFGATDPNQEGVAFGGQHLGPVGSRIIAETFIGLLWLDPTSILHVPLGFRPHAKISGGAKLTLGRLITYALS